MDKEELFKLYDKIYFHELDVREKVTSRLQFPLAILFATFSFFGFLINNTEFENPGNGFALFLGFCSISVVLLFIASYYFIRTFWGHSYDFIPTAIESEKYRDELIETYKEYEDCDTLVNNYMGDYLYRYYAECSSINTEVNDRRSERLHWCNTFIVISVIPILICYALFNVYNLDKNNTDKPQKISIVTPVDINLLNQTDSNITDKGDTMSKKKPPPPPPPPTRSVKGIREIGDSKPIPPSPPNPPPKRKK